MKAILLVTTIAVAFIAPAQAADMPVKAAPPVAAAVYSWTGCYIGGNFGYTWGRHRNSNVRAVGIPPVVPTNTVFADFDLNEHQSGGTVGGQIGCNWQRNNWVVGIETDIQGSTAQSRRLFDNSIFEFPQGGAFDTEVKSEIKYFGTVRGRLGWTVTPTTLLYATGGFAYAQIRSTLHFPTAAGTPTTFRNSDSQSHSGYAVGAGGEASLGQNWTVKLEYLYLDLRSQSYAFPNIAGINYSWDQRVRLQTVRLGLNYKFGWGTVVARY